jgi:glutamate formiminotransferase/formiminotetrahydrofolate cyclodeaminase
MRYLKALGLLVEGQAQVSMNFTDFRHTPLHRVTELIRREAARYGVGLRGAELVGLIPQQALIDAACWYLQLDAFETDQVLETRLAQAQAAGQGQAGIQDLADPESAHASGVAAARTLILAAGLLAKVAGLIARRAGDQGATTDLQNLVARAQDLAQAARAAESADLEAVASWKNAHGSSFEDELHRQEAVQSALQRMAYSPLDVSRVGEKLLDLAEDLAGEDPGLLAPDVLAAAELAQSALKIAALNVSANLARLPQALRTAEECSQAEAIAEAGVARLVQLRSRLQT